MSQNIFTTIDPADSGTDLATALNAFKDAIVSGMCGTSRPTQLQPGGSWVDTTNDPSSWSFKLWTGTDDVEVFVVDLISAAAGVSNAVDSFTITKVSADTAGAILELVKRRIATNGQVLNGDTVAEVRMVGRDDIGANPVVAKIVFTAAENMTASAFGGTLTFYSTPAGAAAATAHMRFLNGIVETIVPHKANAQILVSQDVATAATIAQLNGDKVLVEMTGSTATSIQGINSADDSKVVTIHNRSSANVTLEHADTGAAAADRFNLPESRDVILLPQESASFFHCTTDTRWKLLYASAKFQGFTKDTIYGAVGSWVAPATVSKIRVTAHQESKSLVEGDAQSVALDVGQSLWMWGYNHQGCMGVGDIIAHSSPIAVLGNLKFTQVACAPSGGNPSSIGLTESGLTYAWGDNTFGQLGDNSVIAKSSPVLVVGGYTFKSISVGLGHAMGLAPDGTAYAWGGNDFGELGDGSVVYKSSPVVVLGGLKFREILAVGGRSFGITFAGALYAWGANSGGELGVGDTVARSSPVAVLGSHVFRSVDSTAYAVTGSTLGLTTDGAVYAWGLNANGELGVGDVTARSTPTAVLGSHVFREVFFSEYGSSYGIDTGGVAYAWGYNHKGQLGDNSVVPKSSPVVVVGGLEFKKILAASYVAHGLTEDGSLYAWGDNAIGQLGDNSVVAKSSPVAVVGGYSFREVTHQRSLAFSVVGLTQGGKLYSWGGNVYGELGDGTTVNKSSPVAVLGGLSLKTQDDSTSLLDIPVVGGNTYAVTIGPGSCYFGSQPIGNNIESVEIDYAE